MNDINIVIGAIFDKKTEKNLNKQLTDIEKKLKKITVKIDSKEAYDAVAKLVTKYRELDRIILKIGQSSRSVENSLSRRSKLTQELIEKEKRLATATGNTARALQRTAKAGGAKTTTESATPISTGVSAPVSADATSKATKEVDKLKNSVKETAKETATLGGKFGSVITKIAGWGVATGVVYGGLRQIKAGIGYIVELDKAMTDIRIVTGQTAEEVSGLAGEYNNLAKEMGVTTKEIANLAADLYRQGVAGDDVNERMKAMITYSKISGLETSKSNEIITSTMNSMGISAERAIDVMAKLGDESAAGADEIGEGMQKSGAAMEGLGISYEKAASWFVTISSKTRESASVIGKKVAA